MQSEELFALVFVVVVFSGVFIVFQGLRQRSLQLEMRHKERLAMIERGLLPTDVERRLSGPVASPARTAKPPRSLSVGIVFIAVGFGLMTLIGIAAEAPQAAIGWGGAIVIIGVAFIVISFVTGRPEAAAGDTRFPDEPSV